MKSSSPRPAPLAEDVSLTVTVRWNQDVIAVRHLSGSGSAAVGELPSSMARIPCDAIGAAGWVFARLRGGKAHVRVPEGMMARRLSPDRDGIELIEGPVDAPLGRSESIELCAGAFLLTASADAPDELRAMAPRAGRAQRGALLSIGLAALAHAIVMGLAIQDSRASERDVEDAKLADLKQLLVTAEQRARAVDLRVEQGFGTTAGGDVNKRIGDGRDGGGERAGGESGAMGDKNSRSGAQRRYAVAERAPRDRDLAVSREAALKDAAEFGMIGVLAESTPSPLSPWWGKEESRGADPIMARGDMWGQEIGSTWGAYGLGLSGIGEGGGGRGEGIGLGTIGTIGHTYGRRGPGTGGGGSLSIGHGGSSWGGGDWIGVGHIGRGHRVRGWGDKWGGTLVSGRLPPEAIQRIVRQNFGRFRACYQAGLTHAPALAGTVTVRFVIGRDGGVNTVSDGGSSMPDPAVTSCVIRAFYGLSFPQPEGGIVTVTYPIRFDAI